MNINLKYPLFLLAIVVNTALCGVPLKTPQHVFSYIKPEMEGHPGDYPFPTDMTFRKFADHSIVQTTKFFDPEAVKKGDTIYLADWYIPWFVKYVHPQIKCPYILISNDSDSWHPDSGLWDYDEKNEWPPPVEATRTLLYDGKVAAWFCKNMVISRHPKITQIPIGQNIIYWGNFSAKDHLLNLSKDKDVDKKQLLYMNMQLASHPSRPFIANLFQNQPYCLSRVTAQASSMPRTAYFDELSQSAFTVAPPGYGPDIVRFWEAVALNCIPIVKHSELDDLYADLPALFIYEWEDISEEFLRQKLEEIKAKKLSNEKAYFDYWAQKITEAQTQVRNNENDFSQLEATQFPPETLDIIASVLKQNVGSSAHLLYKGAVLGLRPFQIAEKCPFISKVYVQDRWGAWGHETASAHLGKYTQHLLLTYRIKMAAVNYYEDASALLKNTHSSKVHVFFDLTYLRHSLKDDLETFYPKAPKNTLIVGNMGDETYVSEVLRRFERKYSVPIQKEKDIWFFKK